MNLLSPPIPWRLRARIRRSRRALRSLVSDYEDIAFVRLRGNVGDHLIWAGTRQLLAPFRYREVDAQDLGEASGQLALMSGCGGWCEPFHGLAPQTLVELEGRFETVIVLPSTFDPSYRPVAEVLGRASALVFARDERSYELITPLCRASLAEDCAFYFDFRPYVRAGRGELVAMRTDAESCVRWHAGGPPAGNEDVSVTRSSLDEWLWTIAAHERVITDRAHVMIAGAMLGKAVRYGPTTYHKVPAIARYSLADADVRPLGRSDRQRLGATPER